MARKVTVPGRPQVHQKHSSHPDYDHFPHDHVKLPCGGEEGLEYQNNRARGSRGCLQESYRSQLTGVMSLVRES